jgi:metal-sulfur cluster biosynthetic enzyme
VAWRVRWLHVLSANGLRGDGVDLWLIYGIAIDGRTVRIMMTLTAPGCPLHDVMADWVRRAVLAVPGVQQVEVNLTFDPPWTPARITAR